MYECWVEASQFGVHLPAWMFDASRCATMRLSTEPWVCWQALAELRSLLDAAVVSWSSTLSSALTVGTGGDGATFEAGQAAFAWILSSVLPIVAAGSGPGDECLNGPKLFLRPAPRQLARPREVRIPSGSWDGPHGHGSHL